MKTHFATRVDINPRCDIQVKMPRRTTREKCDMLSEGVSNEEENREDIQQKYKMFLRMQLVKL